MRSIEVYIGRMDNTWYTDFVTIPSDTPDNKIEERAITTAKQEYNEKNIVVAFIGLYNIP